MDARKIRRLAYGGLLTAIIAAITAYASFPIAGGYIHPGDSAIALAAALLGPFAAIPAAVGSLIADLLRYPAYAPYTLVIKGLMGLVAGFGLRGGKLGARALISLAVGALVLLSGYFAADLIMGDVGLALADLPWNAAQALLFIISGAVFLAAKVSRLSGKL